MPTSRAASPPWTSSGAWGTSSATALRPDACAALTANLAEVCLAGNHDLVGPWRPRHQLLHDGRGGRRALDHGERSTRARAPFWLRFSRSQRGQEAGLYHASPRDPVWEYVLSVDQAHACLAAQQERVCLIGHSHVACHFQSDSDGTSGALAPDGTVLEHR